MLTAQESQNIIIDAIKNKKPLAVGKLGADESNNLFSLINNGPVSDRLTIFSGIFPLDGATISYFKKEYLETISNLDILLSWAEQWGEAQILSYIGYNNYKTKDWNGIEPFFMEDNWTNYLNNKKVLVITSHSNTFEYQYPNINKIWNKKLFKDNFELYILKAPLQPQFEQYHNSWVETLEWLKANMLKIDFDVLIVGAGAYGLPLVVEAKKLGKVGIHLGGSIQILFGIKGKRWDQWQEFQDIYNEYWIRPLQEDTPNENKIIEGGCYW